MEPIFIKVGRERINLSNVAWVSESVQNNGSPLVRVWCTGHNHPFTLYGSDAMVLLKRLDAIEKAGQS